MIIKSARFLKSESGVTKNYSGFGVPEIAVVGRSNVGKSSFIN
ncbi:MAG: 50S ribosome-binding GTPase, partial [Clostridia bacterium]|nr:50S ribosome-binding GTPase [Clostridia bacterium]